MGPWGSSTSATTTGGDLWTTWASDATSTSTTANSWAMWNGLYVPTSSTSATADSVLRAHHRAYTTIWNNWNAPQVAVHTSPRSEQAITERMLAEDRERMQERERLQAEARRAGELARAERAKAEEVARELLDSVLTPEQREMRDRLKRFRVVAQDGEVYEIETHRQMHNVFRLRGEQRVEELCLYHPAVPLSDNALAQKLMLETDVAAFRKTANKWNLLDNRKLIQGVG